MPTKTISVTLEAYNSSKKEKREGESFSNVIMLKILKK
ncbi:MAG: antitoxin VapB family protein [Archaeoglobaceae archaeon]